MRALRHLFPALLVMVFGSLLVSGRALGGPAPVEGCSPGKPLSFVIELSGGPDVLDVYAVPEGAVFVVTDVIGFRDGNSDGLLKVLSGERLVGILPLVGIVSQTDLYGVHLVTGIPFPGGQPLRVKKDDRGLAWVTIVGYEIPAP